MSDTFPETVKLPTERSGMLVITRLAYAGYLVSSVDAGEDGEHEPVAIAAFSELAPALEFMRVAMTVVPGDD